MAVTTGDTDRLVRLGAALVTGVGRNKHQWLDLGRPGHDALGTHQVADALRLDVTDRLMLLIRLGLEVDLTARR